MKPQIVFVHGWGLEPGFWEGMIPHFPRKAVEAIDLGFTGRGIQEPENEDLSSAVYITHSLGTMWALKKRAPHIRALVAINGFYCFRHFICKRTIAAMKARLERNPIPQMGEFWRSCGIDPSRSALNLPRLQEGLEWLISWNAAKELGDLRAPVLSLAGAIDPILPVPLVKKEWNGFNLQIKEGGGHALPQTDPVWCAQRIKEFLRGIGMEM